MAKSIIPWKKPYKTLKNLLFTGFSLRFVSGKNFPAKTGTRKIATSKDESISVALFIRYYTRLNGIKTARSNTDFTGEYRLHNCLYKLGYKRKQTQNADIEYVKDRRWYVNVASTFIGWIGI